jgi:hypothetical protein
VKLVTSMSNLVSSLVKRWIPALLFGTLPGLVVLAGYLLPTSQTLAYFRDHLIEWAVIVAGFALFLSMFNVLRVHGGRVARLRKDWPYSLVLLLAALVASVPAILPAGMPIQETLNEVAFDYVISPLGASLAALLAFTLTLAAFRLLRARRSVGSVLFSLIVAVVLLGSAPLTGLEWLADIRDWIVNVPGMAGMRGLLLGVALGTVITALRVFMTIERPHSEF